MCKSVVCSLVHLRVSSSILRFEGNEVDWHKAYGSTITQNHSILLKTIQRCHAPNTFGTVNMEHTINSRLSWSER